MRVFAQRNSSAEQSPPAAKRRLSIPRVLKRLTVALQFVAIILVVFFDAWIFGNIHFPEPLAGYAALFLIVVPLILMGVLVDAARPAARRDTWLGVHVNSIVTIILCAAIFALGIAWSMTKIEFDDGRVRFHFLGGA